METMRATDASGGRDAIAFITLPKPEPGRGQVRVRVQHSAVEDGEDQVLRNTWVGTFLHRQAGPLVLGWNVAGVVDAVGDGVDDLAVGAPVWGHLDYDVFQRQGAFSEFVVMERAALAERPESLPAEQAAAFATVGMTALQALRDYGRLEAGKRVLVIGAGGGIGGVAVAVATHLGAEAVGLCSTKDLEKVMALGAVKVIDRKTEDFLATDLRFDVILDTPSKYSFGELAHLLAPGGTYVDLHPWTLPGGMLRSLFTSKRCRFVQVQSRREDLELLGQWVDEGLTIPVRIDSRYPVSDLGAALHRRIDRARSGQVVVEVGGHWPDA